jgi:DNA-binding MarR family transcriptional regulator
MYIGVTSPRSAVLAVPATNLQPLAASLEDRISHLWWLVSRDALVGREHDPDDARAQRISITAAGRHALEARARLRAESLVPRLERLDDAQRAALAAALPALDVLLADDASNNAAA